jgi:hypothetical protein
MSAEYNATAVAFSRLRMAFVALILVGQVIISGGEVS